MGTAWQLTRESSVSEPHVGVSEFSGGWVSRLPSFALSVTTVRSDAAKEMRSDEARRDSRCTATTSREAAFLVLLAAAAWARVIATYLGSRLGHIPQ